MFFPCTLDIHLTLPLSVHYPLFHLTLCTSGTVFIQKDLHYDPPQRKHLLGLLRKLTSWVDGHAGDPLAVGRELLGHLLLDEVVDAHEALRGHEEERSQRMEGHALHLALVAAEGVLRAPLAHLVDEHLHVVGVVGHDAGQVVALAVPCDLPDCLCRWRGEKRREGERDSKDGWMKGIGERGGI